MKEKHSPRWVILNQSQSPAFQGLLEALCRDLGPGLLFTGTPFPTTGETLVVEQGPAYHRDTLAKRAKTWLRFSGKALVKALGLRNRPLIFAVTNPPVLPQVAWLTKKLKGCPYVLLMWDIYPDHLVESGMAEGGGLIARLWTWFNRQAMINARVVVTIGERMAHTLRRQLGDHVDKCSIVVIPNWADVDTLRPIVKERNPFAVEQGEIGKITVQYSGNMGKTHGLSVFVEVARRLQDDPRISFVFIGDGLGKEELSAGVQQLGLTNVKLLPRQPWETVPLSLAMGDVAIVTQTPGSEHLSMPSKTYAALAVGSAILACTDPGSDLASLVRDHEVGMVCPQNDPAAIEAAIREFASNPDLLAKCRAQARNAVERHFNFQVVYEQFRQTFQQAISEE